MKNIFAAVLFSALTILALISPVQAQEATRSITILGDSISTGYGLPENELSYSDYLGEYYGAEVNNFAVNGAETSDLLKRLKEKEVISSAEKADLICVSIGGNNILGPFTKAAAASGILSGGSLSVQDASALIDSLSDSLSQAASEAAKSIPEIKDRLREINPDANIVFQTVYNPFESSDPAYEEVMKALHAVTAMYIAPINKAVKSLDCLNADVCTSVEGNAYNYTNIGKLDIHPNNIGHMVIAGRIINAAQQNGDGNVFKRQLESISGASDVISAEDMKMINMAAEPDFEKAVERTAEKSENIKKEKDGIKVYWIVLPALAIIIAATAAYCIKKRKSR